MSTLRRFVQHGGNRGKGLSDLHRSLCDQLKTEGGRPLTDSWAEVDIWERKT